MERCTEAEHGRTQYIITDKLKTMEKEDKIIEVANEMFELITDIQDALSDKSKLTLWESGLKLECERIIEGVS